MWKVTYPTPSGAELTKTFDNQDEANTFFHTRREIIANRSDLFAGYAWRRCSIEHMNEA